MLDNACKDAFAVTHPSADCILYDDEDCDGSEGVKEMRQGAFVLNKLDFDVESVSIRKGCYLNIYSGILILNIWIIDQKIYFKIILLFMIINV